MLATVLNSTGIWFLPSYQNSCLSVVAILRDHRRISPMEEHAEKRERGSGSIYHNGSAVWWVKFYVRGIPKRESSGSTDYKVAERLLKRRLAEVITKTYVMRANIKIDELITDLVAEYKRERRKSIGHLEMRWKKHLEPFFGRMKV